MSQIAPASEEVFFPNAPLIELSVEVTWSPKARAEATESLAGTSYVGGLDSETITQLQSGLANIGYFRSRREYPEGFLAPTGTPLITWEADAEEMKSLQIRAGDGSFAVAAFPPYRSWNTFKPRLLDALTVLINSRSEDERANPFERIAVRYIDAFGPSLTEGRTRRAFVEDVLGFKLELPKSIASSLSVDENSPKIFSTLYSAIDDDLRLNVAVGEATVNGDETVVLDMTVASRSSVEPDLSTVVAILDTAHDYIRTVFMSMTDEIRSQLGEGSAS